MRRRSSTTAEDHAGAGAGQQARAPSPRRVGLSELLLVLLLAVGAASVVSRQVVSSRTSGTTQPESTAGPGAPAALPAAWTGATGIIMNVGTCPDSAGICGESNAKLTPAGGTDLESLAFGAQNPTSISSSTGGASAGRLQFDKVTISKGLDTATPALLRFMAEGRVIRTITLTQYTTTSVGPQIVSKYTLNDAFVTDYKIKDGPDHDETFSLVFAQGKVEYFPRATGSSAPQPLPFCWNVANNASC